MDRANLMTKAVQLRKRLGEDGSSPIDIFSLVLCIEKLTLIYYPMGNHLSGMCIKGEDSKSVIAINSAMTLGRQRFSLAHELYHLYFDDTMISICAKKIDSGKDLERCADLFASYFLMPPAELEEKARLYAIRHEDEKLSLEDIIRIEQYFGVSHQAAVIGLKNSSYMDAAQVETFLQTSVRRRAEMMGFAADLYLPAPAERQYRTYGYYIDQAERVFDQGLVSSGKYEELLLDAFRPDLVFGEDVGGDVID